MPHLALQFETFHNFALASVNEIYPSHRLTNAIRFEANTLESGLLINDGKGHFTFLPLPRIAQAAPGFGVSLTEVNGDGYADLYMVQNFFAPQPETGHMDGGLSLLLLGNGTGDFHPVWPDRSGLVVPGDAKGLATMDLNGDGWVDFAITQNDGPLVAFQNRGSNINRSFHVKLTGKPGNLASAGARVSVILSDGTRQTAEVYAGSGYLSQSTNTLFFGLGKTGSPIRVEVIWPDGREMSYPLATDARSAYFTQP
jgi:hypothetical protein